MVEPRESSHFEFYEEGQGKIKVPLRESALYTEDRLGLKVSMISKREYCAPLIIHKYPCQIMLKSCMIRFYVFRH